MKESALAILAASTTSASDAPGFPFLMFSMIDVLKRRGSWETTPT